MFRRFFPAESASVADRFAECALAIRSDISAAQVQGHFMLYKLDPTGSIDNVNELKS